MKRLAIAAMQDVARQREAAKAPAPESAKP
jgi:hypothetical protein